MMKRLKTLFFLFVLSLLPAGCVTHSFFIDFTSDTVIRYKVEGDEIDVSDERMALPDSLLWQVLDRKETESEDGSKTISLVYKPNNISKLVNPIGPPETKKTMCVEKSSNFFTEIQHFEITFPSWQVMAFYGDPEAFVSPETNVLDEEGAEELLPPGEYRRLQNLRLQGLAKGAAQRYLKQVVQLVELHFLEKGEPLDSLVLEDAIARFSAILQVQLMTLQNMEPDDVSLEWYSELRYPMASAVSEATGADVEWCLENADKQDARYKAWMDMQDDTVEIKVVLTSMFKKAKPDTSMGDTLVWTLGAEDIADSDIVFSAIGYSPRIGMILIFVIVLAGSIAILARKFF